MGPARGAPGRFHPAERPRLSLSGAAPARHAGLPQGHGPPRGSPERVGGDRDKARAPHGRRSSGGFADREAPLPWLREARRGAPEVPRDGGGVADRMLLLYVGATSPRAAGSLHRLVGGSAEGQCPFRDLSKPLLNSALGPCPALGVPPARTDRAPTVRRLAGALRASDLLDGDVRRPRALPRNVLPRRQLDLPRDDAG